MRYESSARYAAKPTLIPLKPFQNASSSVSSLMVTCVDLGTGIGCAEMLNTTKYIALVGGGKQPKFPQNKVSMSDDGEWVLVSRS